MMKKNALPKKSQGLSILEILLSLCIIFVILMMATRYYKTTEASEKTNAAISILNALTAAADDWYNTYKTFNGDSPISLQKLIHMGDLPTDFHETSANPWGGEINLNANEDSRTITIKLTNVPQADCQNLVAIMQKRMSGSCPATGFEATYPITTPP